MSVAVAVGFIALMASPRKPEGSCMITSTMAGGAGGHAARRGAARSAPHLTSPIVEARRTGADQRDADVTAIVAGCCRSLEQRHGLGG